MTHLEARIRKLERALFKVLPENSPSHGDVVTARNTLGKDYHALAALPQAGPADVPWPGRAFCEVAQRNVSKLADNIRRKADKQVALDAALALRALLASPTPAEPSPATGVRVSVKPMEWHQPWPDDTAPQRAAAVSLGLAYFADRNGVGWTLGLWYWGCGQRRQIGDYDALALAQAAAQSDYEARIRSALGEQS